MSPVMVLKRLILKAAVEIPIIRLAKNSMEYKIVFAFNPVHGAAHAFPIRHPIRPRMAYSIIMVAIQAAGPVPRDLMIAMSRRLS